MLINTCGIDESQYLKLFQNKSQLLFRTMRALIVGALEEKVTLETWPHDIIWKMYEAVAYDVTDELRQLQRKADPEKYKESFGDSLFIGDEVILEKVESINAKVEALTDYLAELLDKNKNKK